MQEYSMTWTVSKLIIDYENHTLAPQLLRYLRIWGNILIRRYCSLLSRWIFPNSIYVWTYAVIPTYTSNCLQLLDKLWSYVDFHLLVTHRLGIRQLVLYSASLFFEDHFFIHTMPSFISLLICCFCNYRLGSTSSLASIICACVSHCLHIFGMEFLPILLAVFAQKYACFVFRFWGFMISFDLYGACDLR